MKRNRSIAIIRSLVIDAVTPMNAGKRMSKQVLGSIDG